MWALFTRALTAAPSTTKVSITNTSANFLVTAILGMIVFSERVGGLWWLGAAMMGAGCILVGMRDEKDGNISKQQQGADEGRTRMGSHDGQGDDEETITLREEAFDDAGVVGGNAEPYRDEIEEERRA